ncbi:MAG: prolyl oligopeptidase family serine peptidase [Halobaculum sp.]
MSQTSQPIDPETVARLPSFVSPRVSPDGTEIAFLNDRTGRMELYVAPTDGGDWTQVSDGNVPRNPSGGIAWEPDGSILFHRDEDGDEQNDIYRIDRAGSVEPVIETDGQAFVFAVADDGTILYTSDHRDQMNLYAFDPTTGDSTRLTEFDQPVFHYYGGAVGPNGDRIAFAANESSNLDNLDAYVVDRDGSNRRRLDVGSEGAETTVGDWVGDRLLFDDNSTDKERVGVYDLETDEVRWLSDGRYVETAVAFTPDGERAITARTREAARTLVVYDLDSGESRELALPDGVVTPTALVGRSATFLDATRLAVTVQTGSRRPEVIVYDLATDETRTLLPADYGDVDPATFVEPEYVTYESEDGTEIGALLYETPNASPAPAVVKPHGGPSAQSMRAFDPRTQFLVAEGYTVLEPNYRGSTGRGREFKNAINDDWGGMEQVDIRRGAAWLTENRDVDPDRVAVFGVSYGGYSAYCQLTMHPEPWAAGIAWVGMTDLVSLYEESMPHFQSMLERYLGTPGENPELYRERSPITHVENVDAPVGILHGVNDPRVPISQARDFRDALEAEGLSEPDDFEYHELGEEGHASADQDQLARAYERVADFLDRRL